MNRIRSYFGDDWELVSAWWAGMATLLVTGGLIIAVSKLF